MSNLGKGVDPRWEAASQLEEQFAMLWVDMFPDLDLFTEYRFSDRRFRFDFACPHSKVAIELQGGVWGQGGHSTGTGITSDYEKFNLAQSLGWQVYLLTCDSYHQPETLRMIAQAIRQRSLAAASAAP